MTVESASAQNTSRPAAADANHGKGKAGDAHAKGPGGFMAVLASMDSTGLPAATVPDGALGGSGPAELAAALLQRAAAALKNSPGDADALAQGEPAGDTVLDPLDADLSKLLQSDDVTITVAAVPPPVDVPWQPELPVDTTALLAQAAQWKPVMAETAEQSGPRAVGGVVASLAGAAPRALGAEKPEGTAIATATLGEFIAERAVKADRMQKDVQARLASAQAALSEPATNATVSADVRQAVAVQKIVETPSNPTTALLVAASAIAPAQRDETRRERSVFRSTSTDASSPLQTYMPAANPATAANAPAPVGSMETYVAEKVAYWITNDVQNAELKLDGIGELPVEVSIRVQGNEAHVAFRSDEVHARAALENAGEQLKEMLQREGLVLSGVSVGTAGAGDAGGQERKPRQGLRQAGVASVQPARAESVAGSRRSTGGALDLFV